MATTLLLSYVEADGSNEQIFLHGLGDYELAMNEKTGQFWTPTGAPATLVQSGGPPFSNGGMIGDFLYKSYDAVTETIPLQVKAADHNAIVALIRTLKRALTSTFMASPATLQILPDTATTGVYFIVYHGDVQELPSFINEEAGRGTARLNMTITRSPVGYALTGITYQNAQTITNNANASPPNYKVVNNMKGDFVFSGQPLNWSIAPITGGMLIGAGVQRVYAATALVAPTYISTADAISTTSTSGATIATEDTTAITISGGYYSDKVRIVSRIASPTSNLEVRIQVVFGSSAAGSGATLYTSPWIAPGSSTTYVDFGGFSLAPSIRQTAGYSFRIITQARSTNGGSATGTWTDIEIINYATWCRITSTQSLTNVALTVNTSGATNMLPVAVSAETSPLIAFRYNGSTTGTILDFPEVRGDLPIALEDTYLYVATLTGGVHDSTDTGTLTMSGPAVYATFAGSE